MNNFRELKVWQDSINLVTEIYSILNDFPVSEKFVLTDQIRRSVISIPSNIAEGAGRNSQKEFAHFLSTASGSASELATQIEIALRLKFISDVQYVNLMGKLEAIHKMIYALRAAVRRSIEKNSSEKMTKTSNQTKH